jgi:peptide/nickel transport system permease protein
VTLAATAGQRRRASLGVGASLTLLLIAAALVSLWWTPWPPAEIQVSNRLLLPSASHWLGTDGLGRDVASQLLAGARSSLLVGIIAVGIGLSLGTTFGLIAAATQDWRDELIMRGCDLVFAFPAVISAIMFAAVLGPGLGNSILAIGVFNIPVFARVARAAGKTLWTRDFVLAAQVAGKNAWQISTEHIVPNILPGLLVQATIQFAVAILAEAALSNLGLGTQPPQASWGRMLNDAQALLFQAPRLAIFPGLAIALSVLGLNLLGDGLRDWLDPRLSASR